MTVASAELTAEPEVFSASDAAAAGRPVTEVLEARGVPAGAATRLRRLARGLTPFFHARRSGLLVLAELTAPSSSGVWLSSALSEVLSVTVDAPLQLIVAGAGRMAPEAHPAGAARRPLAPSVEILDAVDADALTQQVEARIDMHHAEGRSVLVYRPEAARWIASFEHDAERTGCLMLVRAAKTRKAAVQAFQARLAQTGVPLLGAVLLDREYPIPESLYRML